MTLIRPAKDRDLAAILNLVHELADYEKEPDEVWATLEDYKQAFVENVFEAIVAEVNEQIVGTCIFYLTWSTWKGKMLYLEDFIVKEEYRRGGIGQHLFDAFLKRAETLECTLVKWQVLDWNIPALRFYARNNATIEKNWWNGKLILKGKPS